MTIINCFVIFYLIITLSTILMMPISATISNSLRSNVFSKVPLYIILAMALGITVWLAIFSVVGKIIFDYRIAVPVVFIGMWGFNKIVISFTKATTPKLTVNYLTFLVPVVFVGVHLFLWYLRLNFSNINFDPGRLGAEKLFNLTLQQAFVFGGGFPPESIWLAGEKEAYYILPRAIPGVSSFFYQLLGGSKNIAGIFFHISDTFYHALALAMVAYGIVIFTYTRTIWMRIALIIVSFLPFLSFPARALYQVYNNTLELWSLSRVIDNTINEYPFWNFLWADNHAHSNSAFMDTLLIIIALPFFSLDLPKPLKQLLGVFLGLIAAAVAMSQSASVIIIICAILPIASYNFLKKELPQKNFTNLLIPMSVALFFYIPHFLSVPSLHVQWQLVSNTLTSPFLDYVNVQFTLLFSFIIIIVFGFINYKKNIIVYKWQCYKLIFVSLCVAMLFAWLNYSVISLAIMFCGLTYSVFVVHKSNKINSILTICGIALIIIFPEICAANFNMGENLIRLNTVFKFGYSSFYLLPVMFAFACNIDINTNKNEASNTVCLAYSAAILSFVLLGAAIFIQTKTWQHRLQREHNAADASGLLFFESTRPIDNQIVDFLWQLKGRVVIAEECGYPPKSASYSIAGRISAYSARTAVCGWAMHSYMHQNVFTSYPRTGEPVWQYFGNLEKQLGIIYNYNIQNSDAIQVKNAVNYLKQLGVTHLVFGEYEQKQHPQTNIYNISTIAGNIVFAVNSCGIIKL